MSVSKSRNNSVFSSQRQNQSRQRNHTNIPIKRLSRSRTSSAAMFSILSVSSPPGRFSSPSYFIISCARGHLQFFVDGQRSLQKSILNAFSWFGSLQLILDWYHLEEKCKKQLSLALKGRLIRNEVLTHVLYWLWHGLVDETIEYLDTVDSQQVKAPEALEKLKGYFVRN